MIHRDDYGRGWERGKAAGAQGKTTTLRRVLRSEQAFQRNFDYWNGYITGYWVGQSARLFSYNQFTAPTIS